MNIKTLKAGKWFTIFLFRITIITILAFMETSAINSISEETALKLCETFQRGREIAEKSVKILDESLMNITAKSYMDLISKVAIYFKKYDNANIFTKWYYKKKHTKYRNLLDKFEGNKDAMDYVNKYWNSIKPITPITQSN